MDSKFKRVIFPALVSIVLVLFCSVTTANAQINIRGEVTEQTSGEALIGASIIIEGTNIGTVTEWDGSFQLKVDSLPCRIRVSYTGFDSYVQTVTDSKERVIIKMSEDAVLLNAIEITGSRVSDHRKESPLTVESLDIIAIQQTASNDFYDGLGTLKGVDLTTASLGFTIINTRGFNSTSPVRSLQIIDGVDNQSPGLNFSLGNFLGAPELDVLKVELIQGASSAYFGPNAFNGVIDIRTKDPFIHQGFSASIKGGERNLFTGMFRYAKAYGDKFAFKINGFYLRADDWKARNFDPSFQSEADETNPGGFDAVNEYGDENIGNVRDASGPFSRISFPGLGRYYRKGYKEEDLVDYNTENYKGNAGLFYKINPDLRAEATFNFGSGTTVYQGENRFRLDGIFFWQAKLELKQKDKFFIRAYTTQEDAGDSYDAYATGLRLLDNAKSNNQWTQDYQQYWQTFNTPKVKALEGYPSGIPFDFEAQDSVFKVNSDSLFAWHANAQDYANSKIFPSGAYFEPGTPEFEKEFNSIISNLSTDPDNPGTKFYDKSKLYHVHGEYKFETGFADFTVGGNFRQYTPDTKGTIFLDTGSVVIRNHEFGFYGGLSKKLIPAKLKLNLTVRVDKNQNFNAVVSPAASLIYNPDINNTFRLSFSSAIRNPTLSDQYLNLDFGRAKLLGNITGYDSLVTPESFLTALTFGSDSLEYFNEAPIRPEQVQSIEVGWRGILFEKLWVDMSYYYSSYKHFIGYKFAVDILAFESQTGFPLFFDILRISANAESRVTTQGFSIGGDYHVGQYVTLSGNYSWNVLNKKGTDDPIVPAFNTPEHKFNIGLSGHGMPIPIFGSANHGFGFNINYKWIEGFIFEGSPQFTGFVPTYDLLDMQVNWRIAKLNTTVKVGASNVLNNKQFQTYGGPRIGRLAYISFLYQGKG